MSEINVSFEKPLEIQKGKTYVIRNLGADLPAEAIERILQRINKSTDAKFIYISGNLEIVTTQEHYTIDEDDL